MAMMRYDVLNVGVRELAGGIAPFRALASKSKLLFTNANFVYRDNGEPFLPPFVVREYKLDDGRALRVGYVGLDAMDSSFAKETPEGRVVVMRDPAEAARQVVPAARGRADLLVLLGNLSLRDLTTVLSAAKGFDLALVSYGPRLSEGGRLETVAGVPALYAGDQGKRMGEVRVRIGKKGEPPSMTSNQIFLTRRYPAEPKMQALVDRTIARVNDVNRMAAQRLAGATGAPAAAAPAEIARTHRSQPDGSQQSGSQPNESLPPGGPSAAPAGAKPFVTSLGCEGCHQKQIEIFKGSAHARAFQTLVKANQDFNPACVKCHVTGFGDPGGFVNARQTPDLANVQCEACHGNAAAHVADPQKPFGNVPPRACFTCHTKENSPDFVFFKYWNQIKH